VVEGRRELIKDIWRNDKTGRMLPNDAMEKIIKQAKLMEIKNCKHHDKLEEEIEFF